MRSFVRACLAKPLAAVDLETAVCWNVDVPAASAPAWRHARLDFDDVLRTLTAPLLVTHGRADTVVLPAMAEHIIAACPTVEAFLVRRRHYVPQNASVRTTRSRNP